MVTLPGPRQAGKTTLAQAAFPGKPYLSLEDPDVRMAAEADPRTFLGQLDGAVLDEVQRPPLLLSYLQGLVDQDSRPGRFILTGSHQPRLHEAISQSLAGRTALLTLWPFALRELRRYPAALKNPFALIVRGCLPRLHEEGLEPRRFYNGYLQTCVERDVRALIQLRDLSPFQTFLTLLAGRVGQLVNLAALSGDVGVSATTIRNWLSVLKASFVVFELPPYFENIRRRLVKALKIFFTDVGLAAFLLGIHSAEQAARDPLRGNLYENLVVADVMKGALNRGIRPEMFFFRDSNGQEIDLLIRENGLLTPVEIKSAATFTPGFLKVLERFPSFGGGRVKAGVVLYNGERSFTVRGIRVFNPLQADDPWASLTASSGPETTP